MAYYIVHAQPNWELLESLRQRLDSGEIRQMTPFGSALDYSLNPARIEADGIAVWEEEDYCVPPLAQERAAVLDTYFKGLRVNPVERNKGWQKIDLLPHLWANNNTD